MENMLSYLTDLEEKNVIESLKKEVYPVVLWGAGQIASVVEKYLKEKKIQIADVFVDDAYYAEEMYLNSIRVISKSKLLEKYQKVNVVVGYSDYQAADVLKNEEWVNECFYFACTAYGEFERTPFKLIEDNISKYQVVYDMLADQKSKEVLIAFLQTKLSGNVKYTLQVFDRRMSYFDNDLYRIGREGVYLDVGSAAGENVKQFIKESGGDYGYIYAVEPEKKLRSDLVDYIDKNKIGQFEIASKGAWNTSGVINFLFDGESSHACTPDEQKAETLQVELLDNMFDYKKKVTLLKIQYRDGVEEALLGAKRILKEHEPRIAIMIGYGIDPIYKVPLLIKRLNPNYKLYLRFNRGAAQTIVLYGLT